MSIEDAIACADVRTAECGAEPYTQSWWHERSTDELRLIMSRGFELGPAFDGAMAEAERRACERLEAEERAALERKARITWIRRTIFGGLLLACVLVLTVVERMP